MSYALSQTFFVAPVPMTIKDVLLYFFNLVYTSAGLMDEIS